MKKKFVNIVLVAALSSTTSLFAGFVETDALLAQATKEVGEAFVALANKAKEAGLEGSKALADIMNDAILFICLDLCSTEF